jgi:uncharacterized protein (DUF4213/DUF364 family)
MSYPRRYRQVSFGVAQANAVSAAHDAVLGDGYEPIENGQKTARMQFFGVITQRIKILLNII